MPGLKAGRSSATMEGLQADLGIKIPVRLPLDATFGPSCGKELLRHRVRPILAFLALSILIACGDEDPRDAPVATDDEGKGRWRRAAPGIRNPTPEQEAQLEQLRSLGYLAGSEEAPDVTEVTRHDPSRAYQGLNLYVSGHRPEAILMDMEGAVLHRWQRAYLDVFPAERAEERNPNEQFWRRAYLYPDGSLLAIHDGLAILKLDRDSNVVWAARNHAHHDLDVLPDGDIYTLTREARSIPRVMKDVYVLEDFVAVLASDGTPKAKMSLLRAMERSEPEHQWRPAWHRFWRIEQERGLANPPTDLFHTNSIAVLDGSHADVLPEFAAGNLLLSFCHLEMVAVMDPTTRSMTWSRYGDWALQHDPNLTDRGGLLVFDNNWRERRSRVVETDPRTGEVLWQYVGDETDPFWSRTCGAAQRLPNGNTLISESDRGRAFEVTPDGEIVWEFYNPHRAGDRQQLIATLFEMVRLPPDFEVGWAGGR